MGRKRHCPLPKYRSKNIPTNDAMERIYRRVAYKLKTTPELVREFWEGFNYCIVKRQLVESKFVKGERKARATRKSRMDICWRYIGYLRFFGHRIICERTEYRKRDLRIFNNWQKYRRDGRHIQENQTDQHQDSDNC